MLMVKYSWKAITNSECSRWEITLQFTERLGLFDDKLWLEKLWYVYPNVIKYTKHDPKKSSKIDHKTSML